MFFSPLSSGINLAFCFYALDLVLQSLFPIYASTQFDRRRDAWRSHLVDFFMALFNRIENRVVFTFDIRAICMQCM